MIFLTFFSFCTLAATGIIWACADSDEPEYSVFAPEYFVNKKYAPFFYSINEVYYQLRYGPSCNERYNDIIVEEWYSYFNKQIAKSSLKFLLTNATAGAIDSVYKNFTGNINTLPKGYPDSVRGKIRAKKITSFFDYLKIAKNCESFTVNDYEYNWYGDSVKHTRAPVKMEEVLLNAFTKERDAFIKDRLWFQMVRYYYFRDDSLANIKSVEVFDKYKGRFAKNLTYYRALGYVAGYYFRNKNFALANYLYSKCYNYSYELKIPSYWSFHPQNDEDWKTTLSLAKNNEEKITLWQMLGLQFDEERALKEIVAIDPKSEKLDLLLSRIINKRENNAGLSDHVVSVQDTAKRVVIDSKKLVENIAQKNNTAKPYFWNLAAGYLNFMDSNYVTASKYYALAKKQFPARDTMVIAQSKLLDILLEVKKLRKITKIDEEKLTEPLTWLADLRENKKKIPDLRFDDAMQSCADDIARHYYKQKDFLKEVCFDDSVGFYTDSKKVQTLVDLLNKPNKTPFESVMLRYYPHTLDELYYHQAIELAYKDQTEQAISILKKINVKQAVLDANPYNSRLIDCHDCDAAAPQKQKFTSLSFLQTLQNIKNEIKSGKNVYQNNYLIASAYYNITYYGNDRSFYEADMVGPGRVRTYDENGNEVIEDIFVDMDKAVKYYLIARQSATTNEQKARCTFMLSKCVLNGSYSDPLFLANNTQDTIDHYHIFFKELKDKYSKTDYYKEVLKECGYFRDYINNKHN